jgi:hypothetical protein
LNSICLADEAVDLFSDNFSYLRNHHVFLALQKIHAHSVDHSVGKGAQVIKLEVDVVVIQRQTDLSNKNVSFGTTAETYITNSSFDARVKIVIF